MAKRTTWREVQGAIRTLRGAVWLRGKGEVERGYVGACVKHLERTIRAYAKAQARKALTRRGR